MIVETSLLGATMGRDCRHGDARKNALFSWLVRKRFAEE